MVPSRVPVVALVFAALLATVALVLVSPLSASAQVTHSGAFHLVEPNSGQVAPYKVTQAEDAVLTVCVATGPDVEVLVNGNPAGFGNVGTNGCKIRRVTAVTKITISTLGVGNGGDPSVGSYTLSILFP
jgi:hypothetical protein